MGRLPNATYFRDFGKRTSVIFKNSMVDFNGTHVAVGYMHKGWQDPIWCDLRSGGGDCSSFESVMMEGSDHTKTNWLDDLRGLVVPVSHQSQPLQYFQHNAHVLTPRKFQGVEGLLYSVRPSGGAKAFFTFSLLCDSLRLYGFQGSGTADGHGMSKDGKMTKRRHNYEAEHALYGKLAAGQARQEDFPD